MSQVETLIDNDLPIENELGYDKNTKSKIIQDANDTEDTFHWNHKFITDFINEDF